MKSNLYHLRHIIGDRVLFWGICILPEGDHKIRMMKFLLSELNQDLEEYRSEL